VKAGEGRSRRQNSRQSLDAAPPPLSKKSVLKYQTKLPVITEMDLMRAREIERSCETFRGFSSDQAEAITTAIAQGIAVGRKPGMELAYAPND
jgi:hypothetical protein